MLGCAQKIVFVRVQGGLVAEKIWLACATGAGRLRRQMYLERRYSMGIEASKWLFSLFVGAVQC